jgi:BirA family biotin operon repressor/biotin-[acetyl-CoA-carboxylase] ligase
VSPAIAGDPLPEDFAEAFASAAVDLTPLGRRVLFFHATTSTNDVALALASERNEEGLVVIADRQTAGRGRYGRVWFSPSGSGLYVSVVLAPARAQGDTARATSLLTLTAGVALAQAIESRTGLAPEIKWPNDLIVDGRKLSGILAEAVGDADGTVVLGFGINVGPMAYPPELAARATSLESELGRPIDRASLCAAALGSLASRYRDLLEARFDAILDQWRRRSPASRGSRVTWTAFSGLQTGTTLGIDDRGALLVRVNDRIERIVAGELTWG